MRRRSALPLAVVLAAAVLTASAIGPAPATAGPCAVVEGDVLDADVAVVQILTRLDDEVRVRAEIVLVREGSPDVGTQIVLVHRVTGPCAAGGDALQAGDRYAVVARGATGVFTTTGPPVGLGDGPVDAGGDGGSDPTTGMVLALVAFAGLAFAYVRTRRLTRDED